MTLEPHGICAVQKHYNSGRPAPYVCTLEPGHEGDHFDEFSNKSWPEPAQVLPNRAEKRAATRAIRRLLRG